MTGNIGQKRVCSIASHDFKGEEVRGAAEGGGVCTLEQATQPTYCALPHALTFDPLLSLYLPHSLGKTVDYCIVEHGGEGQGIGVAFRS